MENTIVPIRYVSVWDGGTEIETQGKFNLQSKEVFEVESTDNEIEDLDILDEEYLVIVSTGEIIKDFIEDGVRIVNGQRED